MMTTCKKRSPRLHRAMSEYLREYIEDAGIMFCPSAPQKYQYFQEAWDAGDLWDHPETPLRNDSLTGTYAFYWNYVGFLGGRRQIFTGPRHLARGRRQSKLLVSDYFGYGQRWSRKSFGSCEMFKRADVTEGTWASAAYWSRTKANAKVGLDTLTITLHAGYTDGHVETYQPSEVVPMWVSIASDGSDPYPAWMGPGIFYLPDNALH